ncbi:MAG: alkaline phosphatase family protein [Chloroflexi bacterium]|nr:alkaline phosphatase family protein [Chloroflexota bacterium]
MSDTTPARPKRLFLMAWDGLRPDLISPELTPNLDRFRATGVEFARNHAIVPTVTRVNTATLATGAPPAVHGLPANNFYGFKVEPEASISIGEGDSTAQLRRAYGVFEAPTISDVVHRNGGRTAIVSSGTRGSSQMLHPRRVEAGDFILHPTLSNADEMKLIEERLGSPMPEAEVPDTPRNRWLAEATAQVVIPELRPDALYFWHDDPDKSQHKYGFGHPLALQSIRDADAHFGIVLDGLEAAGLRDETLVIVASDHGYVQIDAHLGEQDALWLRDPDLADVRTAGNGCSILFHLPEPNQRTVQRLAASLARTPGIGVLFSGVRGVTPAEGTFPLAALGMDGPLMPDLLATLAWNDEVSEHGHQGRSRGYASSNAASHGGGSSWEIRNTLIVQGPGVRVGHRTELPSGIGDIAPTVLTALGLTVPASMRGRMLTEAFVGQASASSADVESWAEAGPGGSLAWTRYAGRSYLGAATPRRT